MLKFSHPPSYNLEESDHVWIWEDFQKSTARAAHEEMIMRILSSYLPNQRFSILYDENGKPEIISHNDKIFITLSHSRTCLALALSARNDLGIDVEFIKERKNMTRLARRYFDKFEQDQPLTDIYRSWTAREAFIKAIGGKLFDLLPKIHIEAGDPLAIGLNGQTTHQVFTQAISDKYILALCRVRSSATPVTFFSTSSLK